jgi:dihydrofolate reductase
MTEKIIIAALAENKVIGYQGRIPWHYSEDFKHFKRTTLNHAIIMGRKTFESIGRPLPKRKNIVLTRQDITFPEKVHKAASLDEALSLCETNKAYICGGSVVYAQALHLADSMILTHIKGTYKGDTFFPEWNKNEWKEVRRTDKKNISFVWYERT